MTAREIHVFRGFRTWQGANFAAQRAIAEGRVASSSLGLLMSAETFAHLGLAATHIDGSDGATLSGISGGVLGGVARGLTAVPMVSISGIQLLAAGPISTALVGCGAGAAGNGVIDGLARLGMTESEIRTYEELIRSHGLVVSVSTSDAQTRNRCVSALNVRIDEGAIVTATRSLQVMHAPRWPSRLSATLLALGDARAKPWQENFKLQVSEVSKEKLPYDQPRLG